jgi:hypothetical protein
MPCPFFLPDQPLPREGWFEPRMPLGRAYSGICCAGERWTPPLDRQRESCNSGYVRGHCDRFPAHSTADAVRFSIPLTGEPSRHVIWIRECDGFPVEHGTVDLDNEATESILTAQARAFAASF